MPILRRDWDFEALLYRTGCLRPVSTARMGFWGLTYKGEAACGEFHRRG